MTLLQRIRRRRATVAWAVMPWLLVAWAGAFASPCPGMAGAAGTAAVAHDAERPVARYAEPAAEHAHATADILGHADHCHCPLCGHHPLSVAANLMLAHAGCNTLAYAVPDGRHESTPKAPGQFFVLVRFPDVEPAAFVRANPAPPSRAEARRAATPLNLRLCVFLI